MTGMQPSTERQAVASIGLAVVVWAAGWVAMVLLDGQLDLANLALVFVLTSVLAALWLPASLSVSATIVSALAFNWVFVPPRGTFSIGLHQHAILLLSMGALLSGPVPSDGNQS
jgi:two-component system sensor histidine kinase KdpD